MRPIWTGAIGFGLVNIPVKMYSATQSSSLDLDMLDSKDLSNIRFQRVNENTGTVVEWSNIVKGYKLDDKYVVLTDKDFEAASAKKSKVIEISDFVDEKEIDTIYYDTPYYLEPEKNGSRAYALLRDALLKTNKVGVGTYVLRNKESLAIIKPSEGVIVLNKIRFAAEVRDHKELTVPEKTKVNSKELDLAISLIEQLSEKFDLAAFKDNYNESLLNVIKAKAKGAKIATPKMKVVHTKTDDLMAQLKASLGTKKKKAS
ncbi:MAG: Ku protein [Chitinophagales bacterium]|nr:Ku protein [Chitinophagales bacterium]